LNVLLYNDCVTLCSVR